LALSRRLSRARHARIIRGAELGSLLPGSTKSYRVALYTESDGRAEPQKAAPAISHTAVRAGAKIVQNCAVRSINRAAGRIGSIWTEKDLVRAGAVVVAGGIWSSLFLRLVRLRLPQLAVRSSVLCTIPFEGRLESATWEQNFTYCKCGSTGAHHCARHHKPPSGHT
jgi:glycine/D-amino acid oxidase-like deaminating enzyme